MTLPTAPTHTPLRQGGYIEVVQSPSRSGEHNFTVTNQFGLAVRVTLTEDERNALSQALTAPESYAREQSAHAHYAQHMAEEVSHHRTHTDHLNLDEADKVMLSQYGKEVLAASEWGRYTVDRVKDNVGVVVATVHFDGSADSIYTIQWPEETQYYNSTHMRSHLVHLNPATEDTDTTDTEETAPNVHT